MSTLRPDPQVIVEQILLAHFAHRGPSIPFGVPPAGHRLLRAAGLQSGRARAVNLMAKRVAKQWRSQGQVPTSQDLADEAARLLI